MFSSEVNLLRVTFLPSHSGVTFVFICVVILYQLLFQTSPEGVSLLVSIGHAGVGEGPDPEPPDLLHV